MLDDARGRPAPDSDAPGGAGAPIAALATARGTAALAVVRVGGAGAVDLVASRFSHPALATAAGRTVHVGWLSDGAGRPVDQVVCVVWRGPHSSTGEDVVEVVCHGGDAVAQAVLRTLYDAGARPAPAGEFTRRAFLNGKLDLAQAEAVADLVHAESRVGHRAAVAALRGRVSDAVAEVREALVETAALVELELDFAEEDVEFADRAALGALLDRADAVLGELLSTARLGALARDGVRVVLGGRPNAGKSTLLNALVGQDRAIVSPTPGTTRDAVEAEAELGGLRFRFVDTAGLRETADAVEAEGTRRARAAIDGADALLYVVDATVGLDAEERAFLDGLAARRPALPVLVVHNKADLYAAPPADAAPPQVTAGGAGWSVSAREALAAPAALDGLRGALLDAVRAGLAGAEAGEVAVNERHRAHLDDARGAVRRARAALDGRGGADTLALDLRAALRELGLVTGAVTTENVLDAVFSRFCIGK
ncbi:tRNA uridine-5-carboxymethylaminomethyl(34) synthesis GTPase MnmE [Rubrivirga sp. S365]|uniref:tRNA uridine-5-carboxymethylaminomethyl(34) synthesis GTPase MnmE n=1 Tax=Rubrivirga sp. S365 TaxID=3076080 RepID=UPI0028C821F3|nr:tRNA uridine-5-carboxymethylaminomethyl(34) synthesis GTPase MnmE [Rubrivirga sp. S365]MDT7855845.1 tRNA uridine-5-carboxymethylaminomethyl(34) synthesis GTPase MnmE [Rubrivirga sp. S365]